MAITNPKYVFEVIELVSQAKKKEDKIFLLKKHVTPALRDVLKGTYDDAIVWNLPPGRPPYEPAEEHNAPSNLKKQNIQFKYFVQNGPGKDMIPLKRETMFIRLIESIHPKDAELVLNMINKQKIIGVSKALVQETFPGLISK